MRRKMSHQFRYSASLELLRLVVSDSVEGVEASARQALPSDGGSGNRHDKWACREMTRKTRVSLIHFPTIGTITSVPYL